MAVFTQLLAGITKVGMACSMTSYHSAATSQLAIVALEETIIRKISHKDAKAVAEHHPCFHVHLRRITQIQASQMKMHYLILASSRRHCWRNCRSSAGGC